MRRRQKGAGMKKEDQKNRYGAETIKFSVAPDGARGTTPGHLDLHSAAIASFAPRDTPPYS
jgi:hypothetical protein